MKKTLLITTAVLSVLGAGTYAMWWHGMWNWQGRWMWNGQWHGLGKMVTSEERAKLQSMSESERQSYAQELRAKYGVSQGQWMWKGKWQGQRIGQGNQAKQAGHNENPADLIANIPSSDVNDTEKTLLINQYGEEKMARDIYNYAYEKYGIQTFANIAKSEQKHMDTIKVLLDRYNIEAPSDYAKDNDLYVTLKNKVDQSEKDAIEVGIMIEMVDIDNIANDIRNTDNDDFKVIFTNIWWASYNHLRGFVNALANAGYTTDLEWTKYINQEEVSTRWGGLKTKLAEKLESEGVSLPEQAKSSYLKWQCENEQNHFNTQQNQWRMRQSMQNITDNTKKYLDQTKVQKYKSLVESKYSSKLDSYSQEKLEEINTKIDDLVEKIANSTSYSDTKKEVYINLLVALKASILDRINDDTSVVDWLLN